MNSDGRSIIDNLNRHGYYRAPWPIFPSCHLFPLSLSPLAPPPLSLCEYSDAFLAEAVLIIRRTRARSRRPFGPSGRRRRRCARLRDDEYARGGRTQKKQVENSHFLALLGSYA